MHDDKWEIKKFGATFRVKIVEDDSQPDLSYMGDYAGKLSGEDFYVDRREGVLYGETTVERREIKHLVKDGSGALLEPIDPICERLCYWVHKVLPAERRIKIEVGSAIETLDFNATPELRQWFDDWNWLWEHEDEIINRNAEEGWVDAEYRVILADNLSKDYDHHTYRYWIPGDNHLPHRPGNWLPYHSKYVHSDGIPPEEIDKLFAETNFNKHGIHPNFPLSKKEFWLDVFYACEDYKRMEDYGKTWWEVGVVVELVIDGDVIDQASLWGIESDSDDSYFDEVADSLVHDIAIRTHERIAHGRKVASHLGRIGRNYKAWEKRQEAKREKQG